VVQHGPLRNKKKTWFTTTLNSQVSIVKYASRWAMGIFLIKDNDYYFFLCTCIYFFFQKCINLYAKTYIWSISFFINYSVGTSYVSLMKKILQFCKSLRKNILMILFTIVVVDFPYLKMNNCFYKGYLSEYNTI
jgi:hypothetical protein